MCGLRTHGQDAALADAGVLPAVVLEINSNDDTDGGGFMPNPIDKLGKAIPAVSAYLMTGTAIRATSITAHGAKKTANCAS